MRRTIATLTLAAVAACAPQDQAAEDAVADPTAQEIALGPTDGFDLPPTDIERVQAGDIAPDFTLTSLAGPPVTLSDFRGEANVILVFYRGHW